MAGGARRKFPEVSGRFRKSLARLRHVGAETRLASPHPERGGPHAAQRTRVHAGGCGVRRSMRASRADTVRLQRGLDTVDANTHLGFEQDTRRRGSGSSRTAPHATMPPCQRATCSRQHATCNRQHATCNRRHAACSIGQLAARHALRSYAPCQRSWHAAWRGYARTTQVRRGKRDLVSPGGAPPLPFAHTHPHTHTHTHTCNTRTHTHTPCLNAVDFARRCAACG